MPILICQNHENYGNSSDYYNVSYYKSDSNISTVAQINQFLSNLYSNKIKRILRSQQPNKELVVKNVYNLVSSNFAENIQEADNFLVFFTKDNCLICDEHKKEFYELADYMVKEANIIKFGIIDGLGNELEDLKIDTYPTVILFKTG